MVTHSSVLSWRIPRDWGAWWAAVYGVAQSRTQLKWLSSSSSVYMSVSVCQSVPAFFCYLVSIHYFPGGSEGKKSACSTGDLGSIPGSGRSPGEGNGNPLQHTCLENSMDRGSWQATVHGVTKRVGHDWVTSLHPYICSLPLCLYFCFVNKITHTIFLDSTYMH